MEYAKLRNPLLINDLNMQYFIQDRYSLSRNTKSCDLGCQKVFPVTPCDEVQWPTGVAGTISYILAAKSSQEVKQSLVPSQLPVTRSLL